MCEMSFAPLKSSWLFYLGSDFASRAESLEKLVARSDPSLRLPLQSSFLWFILPFGIQCPEITYKWIKNKQTHTQKPS